MVSAPKVRVQDKKIIIFKRMYVNYDHRSAVYNHIAWSRICKRRCQIFFILPYFVLKILKQNNKYKILNYFRHLNRTKTKMLQLLYFLNNKYIIYIHTYSFG